ncbi:MAG: hypothetical protein RL701_2311, partial [Pseudomonadota bacterium]
MTARVQQVLQEQLGAGAVSMKETAKRLALSVATLRRKLE